MDRRQYQGPALFSVGLRPFFLLASIFAVGVIPVWMMIWTGHWTSGSQFTPADWHAHELIFGYTSAVISGFVLTAIPNWTKRPPIRGWPLVGLAMLWLAGRFAVAGFLALPAVWVLVVDGSFLAVLCILMARELLSGHNFRNLVVLIPISILLVSNVVFHLEADAYGEAEFGRRAGLAAIAVLIALIGGRIIPAFTRNWLVKTGATRLPVPFARLDAVAIGVSVAGLSLWVADVQGPATGAVLAAASVLQFLRLSRWQGLQTRKSAILLMLHMAYLCLPAGLAALAVSAVVLGIGQATGTHLLGIGGIGGMTFAVMIRASLGHTGHPLVAGPWITLAFASIILAAIVRAALPDVTVFGVSGLVLAAMFWTTGFAMLSLRLAPLLLAPSAT